MAVHGTPVSSFVLQVESFEGTINAIVLGQSRSKAHICTFATYVASHEMLGKDWDVKTDGNIFFDPRIDAREPSGDYLRWMLPTEIAEFNANASKGCDLVHGILHVGDARNCSSDGHRKIKRRYRIFITPVTIYDLMEMESSLLSGDTRNTPLALPSPSELPASATAAVASTIFDSDKNLSKYLPESCVNPQQQKMLTE